MQLSLCLGQEYDIARGHFCFAEVFDDNLLTGWLAKLVYAVGFLLYIWIKMPFNLNVNQNKFLERELAVIPFGRL